MYQTLALASLVSPSLVCVLCERRYVILCSTLPFSISSFMTVYPPHYYHEFTILSVVTVTRTIGEENAFSLVLPLYVSASLLTVAQVEKLKAKDCHCITLWLIQLWKSWKFPLSQNHSSVPFPVLTAIACQCSDILCLMILNVLWQNASQINCSSFLDLIFFLMICYAYLRSFQ